MILSKKSATFWDHALGFTLPVPPMRGMNFQYLSRLRIGPPLDRPAASKHERVRLVFIDDGQFKIPIKRGCGYRFPLHEPL